MDEPDPFGRIIDSHPLVRAIVVGRHDMGAVF